MKYIKLTQEKYAIVDDEDFDLVNQYKWHVIKRGNIFYGEAYTPSIDGCRKHFSIHILIMGKKEGCEIDHINGNGLDNRRINLRFVNKSQNRQNEHYRKSKKYNLPQGVFYNHKQTINPYYAMIGFHGTQIRLGAFNKVTDAARAYDFAAKIYYGSNAKLNYPHFDYSYYLPQPIKKQKSSCFIGVYYHKPRNRYGSCIRYHHQAKHIGYFKTEIAAAKAYDQFVRDHKLNRSLNFE